MPKLTIGVNAKFTRSEIEDLSKRATDAGMKLSPYVRRETLRSLGISSETKLVLSAVLQLQEMMLRLFSASIEGDLDVKRLRTIANVVRSIRTEPLVAELIESEKGRKK